jgi:nucleoside 2-deoxyribosyltransferase
VSAGRRIYVAGPLFGSHERWLLERIATTVEAAGYATFLPHRDVGVLTNLVDDERRRIFRADLEAMTTCDACVILLTGPDHDSGSCAELGYFFATGKPCVGYRDDPRFLNNLIWGLCGEGRHLVERLEDLTPLLDRLLA